MKLTAKIISALLSFVLIISVCFVSAQAADSKKKKTSAESGGITIHYKSEESNPFIYYWNSLPQNIEVAYPGAPMNTDKETGDGWYTYTFPNVTKINLMFTNNSGKQLSAELTRNSGEWWYLNNRWRSKDPSEPDTAEDVDFREETIYFVIPTRFYDGDKTNNVHCWDDSKANNPDSDPAWRGDFKGLADKLDYIKALGFSAIWITPVVENASGYDYHGYHAMNFEKVDPRYESKDFTYQDLIDAAHEKGMKVIQDVVWNHTGNFGENTLCPEFTKDYTKDLSKIEECMVPTKQLLEAAGVEKPEDYWNLKPQTQYDTRLNLMKNTTIRENNSTGMKPDETDYAMSKVSTSDKFNKNNYFHTGYFQSLNWDDWTCKYSQIAGDCVDLNTENPAVAEYTNKAYAKYMDMGVDSFRVDTVRHIPRLSLNMMYNQQMLDNAKDAGRKGFYMFGEICCRYSQTWYRDHAEESVPFYTWAENSDIWAGKWSSKTDAKSVNDNMNLTFDHYRQLDSTSSQPTSDNAFLDSNLAYHKADYSKASGMNAIDFTMHWSFDSASGAFGAGKAEDKYFNDSTWNVMYVQSHDYSPDRGQKVGFTGGTDTWAENMDLMFTFRGIPCLYYGNEVEFQKGCTIDEGPNIPLSDTARAYYGDYLEGSVTATDFSKYTASGKVADTLEKPLCKHLAKLNAIRRAIPALQKGQYSVNSSNVSGNMAYIRRYTDKQESIDSLACVTISGNATFKNIPNGRYIDAVTGDVQTVSNNTLTASASGKANMRVYVCCASGFTGIGGKIGGTSSYLK
ncbi:MAG: alpha-amylase family glycosyl hydrolase [Ruminococcus sp.]|nr:alpha-amylase family glycosyl hydrolase [Ruminococcus sp.]